MASEEPVNHNLSYSQENSSIFIDQPSKLLTKMQIRDDSAAVDLVKRRNTVKVSFN